MLSADVFESIGRITIYRRRQNLPQCIGYAFQRRMDDQGLQALVQAVLQQSGNRLPIFRCRYTAATEFHDYEGRIRYDLWRTQQSGVLEISV